MIHQDRGGVLAGWSQAQQHMTSPATARLIGGRLWQASRVELAPDQPRRSFAPCGNQRGTPTNSRKQTTESRAVPPRPAAAHIPTLHYNRWYYSKGLLRRASARMLYARNGPARTDANGNNRKNSLFSTVFFFFKSWLINNWFFF